MNKMFLIAAFCCSATMATAQEYRELQDSHHNTIGYIGNNATVFDKNKAFAGQFKGSQYGYTVVDHNHTILGYVRNGGAIIENAKKEQIGGITRNGVVENADHQVLGYFKMETGAIEDASHNIVGYELGTEPMWAVPYYLFFKFKS